MAASFWTFTVGLALLLPAGTGKVFDAEEKQPAKKTILQLGHWKAGTLTTEDAVDNVWGTRCKEYEIPCEPGQTYVIDMEARSKDFDPVLRLKDRAGRQWASDNDAGVGCNARIVFTCPRKDNYIIVATTYAGDTGDFELIVRNPVELRGQSHATVDRLPRNGVQYIRELHFSERPYRAYPVKLERGRTYVFEATAQDEKLKPILLLRRTISNWRTSGRDENRQGAATARIVYTCPETTIYFVLVTTTEAGTVGSFELKIEESGGK
jgi:hypothetical protein